MGLLDSIFGTPYSEADGYADSPNQGGLLNGAGAWLKDPRNANALASFGEALSRAGAPSTTKNNWGGALGQAFAGMRQGNISYDDLQAKRQMQDLQMKDILAQSQMRDAAAKKANQGLDVQNAFFGKLAGQPSATPPMGEMGGQPNTSGGVSSLSLNDLAMAAVAGVPGAKELLEIKKFQMQGTKFEPGSKYQFEGGREMVMPKLGEGQTQNPQGVVSNAPGYVGAMSEAAAAQAAATEGAKAQYDLTPVPQSDGTTRMMPRAQAVQSLGGSPKLPPNIPPEILAAAQRGPFTAQQQPNGQLSIQTGPQLGVSQSDANKTYGVETAKNAVETYKGLQNAGMQAPTNIAKYRQLGSLLDGVEGNKLSSTGLEISKFANSIGIKLDPRMANKEASVALSNQMALALRNPSGGEGMPGALSNSDREFLTASTPTMSNSAQGRKQMVESYVKLEQRKADVAQKARMWQQRFGRIDAPAQDGKDFATALQDWSEANPLFK